jgi:hypothetical protein
MDPVTQGQKAINDAWGIVQNQWDIAVKVRWQNLQALINALGGIGR